MILVRAEFHDRRGCRGSSIAGVVLAVLLATLATFQYRWLGEVGEAERERMRAGLQTRAADFTQEFDRELTRIYVAFHGEPDVLDRDPGPAIARRSTRRRRRRRCPA